MDYSNNNFVCDISNCIKLAKAELQDRKNGIQGESTVEQLEIYIIPDLSNLLSKIENEEKLPPNTQRDRYLTSFGYAFKEWGWDIKNPSALYLQLLKIHENYRKI